MKIIAIGSVFVLASSIFIIYIFRPNPQENIQSPPIQNEIGQSSPPESGSQNPYINAKFTIYTLGTKRDFSNPMYQNLSSSAYIASGTGEDIIALRGTTWGDFFDTLPFSIDKECLVTGTGQKFCTNNLRSLNFYINGEIDSNLLSKNIEDRDELVIKFE